jgi:hypothetical protein
MSTLLESQTDSIDQLSVGLLGDTIDYQPAGGFRRPIVAFVNHEEIVATGGAIGVIGQDIEVEAFFDVMPDRPTDQARIWLPKYAGVVFKPISPRLNPAGTGWMFALKKVSA